MIASRRTTMRVDAKVSGLVKRRKTADRGGLQRGFASTE